MKIVVFDDDPTGSQSVYGCPLILDWNERILDKAIDQPSELLFFLANTRSMTSKEAELRTRKICKAFKDTCKRKRIDNKDILLISRGDSTLRGYGFLEPEIIAQELGPFDATFHVPAFIEGGRTTRNGMHLLNNCPVHLTNFASDKIFGYSTSFLPDWLEEISQGKISSKSVLLITSEQLNFAINSNKGMNKLFEFLQDLSDNSFVVVDAENTSQLSVFAKTVMKLMGQKKFLFRSAASLISAFAQLPVNSIKPFDLAALRIRNKSLKLKLGLIIVGSHVKLADQQLEILLKDCACEGIELPVRKIARILDGSLPNLLLNDLENQWFFELKNILDSGKTPVLFTSRGEIHFASNASRMIFGLELANLMARLFKRILPDLGYVISKGGITTQILLEKGLDVGMVHLKGQILPGLSMVWPETNDISKQIPIITFPGNLGSKETLLEAWKLMEKVD
tara:strand:+ start:5759 stop:7117 length:1359 start_codon:yes stop_codon:yes gene_type:complete